jgi:hypothetical protein
MNRLAIGLGNKHLGGLTGVDTIGDLGLEEVSAWVRRALQNSRSQAICGLARQNSNLLVGLEISGAHCHSCSWQNENLGTAEKCCGW